MKFGIGVSLTLSNPIFLPTAYSPALSYLGGKEVGRLLVIILQLKKNRNRKSTTCAICWLKSVLHEEKRRTGSDSGLTNATNPVSDVFRHRSGTGKSYCRTRFDVGSERVKSEQESYLSKVRRSRWSKTVDDQTVKALQT
jgi:hypothetical protein